MSEHEKTVGEVVTIEGKQYRVEKRTMKPNNITPIPKCDGCSLYNEPVSICWNARCSAMERDDGLYVKFIEVTK